VHARSRSYSDMTTDHLDCITWLTSWLFHESDGVCRVKLRPRVYSIRTLQSSGSSTYWRGCVRRANIIIHNTRTHKCIVDTCKKLHIVLHCRLLTINHIICIVDMPEAFILAPWLYIHVDTIGHANAWLTKSYIKACIFPANFLC
jgi:hypothetical protein